ncbi:hypothetical protein EYF80_036861 [Liparis tanakae]|uniref:Uncharacterized protein n=1 Tax=Liparis tanakae TaxID=230148 RepID=A0A4Z2GJ70_9TELE|nr:hypothetical protein EYF80_036861 [Liparis tanakae]
MKRGQQILVNTVEVMLTLLHQCSWINMGANMPNLDPRRATSRRHRTKFFSLHLSTKSLVSNMSTSLIQSSCLHQLMKLDTLSRATNEPVTTLRDWKTTSLDGTFMGRAASGYSSWKSCAARLTLLACRHRAQPVPSPSMKLSAVTSRSYRVFSHSARSSFMAYRYSSLDLKGRILLEAEDWMLL